MRVSANDSDVIIGEIYHAKLISLLDVITLLNRDLACRHLYHSHRDDAHEPDMRIIGLDEDDSSRSNGGDVPLSCSLPIGIGPMRIRKALEQRL